MKKGFTLIELLVAGSIFSIISLIAVNIFLNVSRTNRRINLENHIYTESHILMEKIAREIRQGTIDYEEYQSRQVLLSTDYGEKYGEYAKKFYHPGYKDNANNLDTSFGLICADGTEKRYDPKCVEQSETCSSTCSPYLPSQDFNTGKNPFDGSSGTTSDDATALCDDIFNEPLTDVGGSPNRNCDVQLDASGDIKADTNGTTPVDFEALHFQKELYIINSTGDQKTILAREVNSVGKDGTLGAGAGGTSDDEYALSIVRLNGEDQDQDDIRETWTCTEEFNCTKNSGEKPDPLDLADLISHATSCSPSCPAEIISGENFIPLTPSSINVTSVKFLIAPLEDPRKAYAEDDTTGDYILMQPYVTIVLTIKPAYKEAYKLYGTYDLFPEITLQTTVSSRIY